MHYWLITRSELFQLLGRQQRSWGIKYKSKGEKIKSINFGGPNNSADSGTNVYLCVPILSLFRNLFIRTGLNKKSPSFSVGYVHNSLREV